MLRRHDLERQSGGGLVLVDVAHVRGGLDTYPLGGHHLDVGEFLRSNAVRIIPDRIEMSNLTVEIPSEVTRSPA
jgi:hypothetical protein